MYPLEIYQEQLLHSQIPNGNEGTLKSIVAAPFISLKSQLLKLILFFRLHRDQRKALEFCKSVHAMPYDDAFHFKKLISSTIHKAIDARDQLAVIDPDSYVLRKYEKYLECLYRLENHLVSRTNKKYAGQEIDYSLGTLRYKKPPQRKATEYFA